MLRTFLALPLDAAAQKQVSAYLDSGESPTPGRRVAPQDMHVTLVFLGEADEGKVAEVEAALSRIDLGAAFDLELQGLRAFPDAAEARILWLEPTGDLARLRELQQTVRSVTSACGFTTDLRQYNPHLTVSRLSRPGDVRAHSAREPSRIALPAREVALFRRVAADSPAYAITRRWPLR